MPDKKLNASPLYVRAEWDEEAGVWVATSDDVPGLATEAVSMEDLIRKLKTMVPELLELNRIPGESRPAAFEVLSRRFETLEFAGV
jgi:predicted RNase H-like HicB family nuclease